MFVYLLASGVLELDDIKKNPKSRMPNSSFYMKNIGFGLLVDIISA
jgi:hypothetical protein